MKMFEGWGFNEETNLQEFIFMVNSIAKKRFSINTRRAELFCLKQKKNENLIDFWTAPYVSMGRPSSSQSMSVCPYVRMASQQLTAYISLNS